MRVQCLCNADADADAGTRLRTLKSTDWEYECVQYVCCTLAVHSFTPAVERKTEYEYEYDAVIEYACLAALKRVFPAGQTSEEYILIS